MRTFVVSAILMLIGCSYAADQHYDQDEYVGATDELMLEFVNERIKSGGTSIKLSSFGGKEETALKIAKIIQENNINITVRGYCTSSCAIYLLPAAGRVFIEEDAIVAMHTNSFGLVELNLISKGVYPDIERNASEARELYKRAGVSSEILVDATASMGLHCVKEVGRAGAVRVFGVRENWVPSREYLNSKGLKFQGFWPKTKLEAERVFYVYFKDHTRFIFGEAPPAKYERYPLSRCQS